MDTSALRFLAAAALEDLRKLEEEKKVKEKVKEEEKLKMLEKEKATSAAKEERMQKLNDRVRLDLPLTQEEWAAQAQHLLVLLWVRGKEEEEEENEVASLILLVFFLRLLVSGSHLFRVGLA